MMDGLKSLVGAGCSVDGVVAAQNPFMKAVDATIQRGISSTTGPAAAALGHTPGTRPAEIAFAPSATPVQTSHPSMVGMPASAAAVASRGGEYDSILARAWQHSGSTAASLTAPPHISAQPAHYTHSMRAPAMTMPFQHQSQHMYMAHAVAPTFMAPQAAPLVMTSAQYPHATAPVTASIDNSLAASEEASRIVAALEKASAQTPALANSELMGFMRDLSNGSRAIHGNTVVDGPVNTEAMSNVRSPDMPTEVELADRINTIEQLWRNALLLPEDASGAPSLTGLGTGGMDGLDLDRIWAEASTAAAQARRQREATAGLGYSEPATLEEYVLRHAYARSDDAAAREIVEKAWADATNEVFDAFADGSAEPLQRAFSQAPGILGDASSNPIYRDLSAEINALDAVARQPILERMVELADSHFAAGEMVQAIEIYEAVLHVQPDASFVWYKLGTSYAEIDKDAVAIQCFNKAVEEDPYNLPALIALGVSHVNEKNTDKAFEVLKEWVDHHPLLHDTAAPADAYSDGTLVDKVTQLMLAAQNRIRDDADVATVLGVIYNASQEYELSAKSFTQALRVRPSDYTLWNKLGATYANAGHHEKALEAFAKATELKPGYARGWLNAGLSEYKLKRNFVAAQDFLRALRIAPASPHMWALLRIAFSKMDRYDLVARTEACNPDVFAAEFGV